MSPIWLGSNSQAYSKVKSPPEESQSMENVKRWMSLSMTIAFAHGVLHERKRDAVQVCIARPSIAKRENWKRATW